MRNLAAYPLTDDEVQAWLKSQMDAYLASGLVGGMQGVIISHLQKLAAQNPITTETSTTTAKG